MHVLIEATISLLLLVEIHVGVDLTLGPSPITTMIVKVALGGCRSQRPLHGTHTHLLLLREALLMHYLAVAVGRGKALGADRAAYGAQAALLRRPRNTVGPQGLSLVRQVLQVRRHGRLQLHVVTTISETKLSNQVVLQLGEFLADATHVFGGAIEPITGHGRDRAQLILISIPIWSILTLHDRAVLVIEMVLKLPRSY